MAQLFAWGSNTYGELGQGDTSTHNTPTQVGSDANWSTAVFTEGRDFCVVVRTDGTLWAWGCNVYGQLGLGDTTSRSSPVQVGSDKDWSAAAAGYGCAFAIKSDGSLWAWGANGFGQLGLGDTTNRSSPVQVGSDTNWSAAFGAYSYALALKTDGTLWACGYNGYGQLGQGDTTSRSSPVQVGADTNWSAVSCLEYHVLAVKTDGTLWAWGNNNYGQLGLGDTVYRSFPTQVGSDANWSAVGAGYRFSLAAKSDGTLWSWGNNSYGQLGLGDTTNRSSPVQVGSDTNWSKVFCREPCVLAIKTDGSLWACGGSVARGLGNVGSNSSPVQVGSRTDWATISGGWEFSIGFIVLAPAITAGYIAPDNSYCKLVFSKIVYSDAGASQALNKDDFSLTFTQNGGGASAVSISGLYADSELSTPLASGTGYSTVYAKLSITGVPTGVETIEIKPASDSAIYDAYGTAMPDTETTGALNLYNVLPAILQGVMANDNSYMQIDFSEKVWADSGNTAELTPDSFLVDFQQNGGNISAASINALFQDAALSTPLASGEGYSTVYAQLLVVTSGFPTGDETIEIKPKDGSSIYDSSGGAMDASETTGVLHFHPTSGAISLNWSDLDPVISALRSIVSLCLISLFGHGLHVFYTDRSLFQEVENILHSRVKNLPLEDQSLGLELLDLFRRFYTR